MIIYKDGKYYVGVRSTPEGVSIGEDWRYIGSPSDPKYLRKIDLVASKLILEICCTREDAALREVYYHKLYDCANDSNCVNRVNATEFTICNNRYGISTKHSEETKELIRQSLLGRKHTTERRLRQSQAKRPPRTQEAIQKAAEKMRGRKRTAESRLRQSEAAKGRVITDSAKIKMSEAKRCSIVYKFSHEVFGVYEGRQSDFRSAFSIPKTSVCAIVAGTRKHTRGWYCVSCFLPIQALISPPYV